MSCPSCGARFYVLARYNAPMPESYDGEPVALVMEPEVHACELVFGDTARPLCHEERVAFHLGGYAFTTLAPGTTKPYGPDEARLLTTCEACREKIAPARRNAFALNNGEEDGEADQD